MKIIVPEYVMEAALACCDGETVYQKVIIQVAVTAAFRALAERPIVPTDEQLQSLRQKHWRAEAAERVNIYKWATVEWQRRMFLAPEVELPTEVRMLEWTVANPMSTEHNEAIRKAYELGLAQSKPK